VSLEYVDSDALRHVTKRLEQAVAEAQVAVDSEVRRRESEAAAREGCMEKLTPALEALGKLVAEVEAEHLDTVEVVASSIEDAMRKMDRARRLVTLPGDSSVATAATQGALAALESAERICDAEAIRRAENLAAREQAKGQLQPLSESFGRCVATADVSNLNSIPAVKVSLGNARAQLARVTAMVFGQHMPDEARSSRGSDSTQGSDSDVESDDASGSSTASPRASAPRQGPEGVVYDAGEISAALHRLGALVTDAERIVTREKGTKEKREKLRQDGL
jgi:hypothetical protein